MVLAEVIIKSVSDTRIALDLALTIRHDGRGGVADDLATPDGLTRWVRERRGPLGDAAPDDTWAADEQTLEAVRSLRAAVRALFAHAVRPGEPSPADAGRLLPFGEALRLLNTAAAAVPTVPHLDWVPDRDPVAHDHPIGGTAGPDVVPAALARAAVGFLAGPDRTALRACHAPRCVRYFVKEHPRQEWCKPSCGNRARVARHHERHRTP
ncbi:ABATE domain-containing protein [Streptomyces sp. NPDC006510]|uniref:CGNR zinc finger domain-containing protein n=1 Tax=Streptomyces sp. NPDC006510 TaxID=3155600 RepID=UPI0033B43D23